MSGISKFLKNNLLNIFKLFRIQNLEISLKGGNIYIYAKKT